jgi:probable O-glycosylation ligase (exosortase A-associated)
MRDILLTLILGSLLPSCFRRPFVGLLVFSWLAYMRAQDLTWGFARGFRWSLFVALAMFAGLVFQQRKRWLLPDVRCYIMMVLVVLAVIGVAFSYRPDSYQFGRLTEYGKIVAVAIFTTAVVTSREHLRILLWVVALSFAFYGVKNGLMGVLTGLSVKVIRGPGGMMEDNNAFALALAMAVPMLVGIGLSEKRQILRRAFLISVPFTVITIGLTYSRGGLLALGAGTMVLVWHSRNRLAGFALLGLIGLAGLMVMPEEYKERIESIGEYETEGSAQARLKSWKVAVRMATDNPVLGVGLKRFRHNYLRYEPNPTPNQLQGRGVFEAHNSYLQVWAEMGTVALSLYLSLMAITFASLWQVRREARRRYFSSWIINYATMLEASLATFVVGGVFLNRADFDFFYHFIAIAIVFAHIARQEMLSPIAYPVREGGRRGPVRLTRGTGFGARPRQRGFRKTPLLEG